MKIIGYTILVIASIMISYICDRAKVSLGYGWLIQMMLMISFMLIFSDALFFN